MKCGSGSPASSGGHYRGAVRTLVGLLLVLTGSFLTIIGLLGAIGTGITLRVLPGRKVVDIAALPARSGSAGPAAGPERVVVRGIAAAGPGGTFTAPLSGAECVWYLVTQTAVEGERRSTVDRYAPQPFTLRDAAGTGVLVGPTCPALEQIAPSFRETREDPHPWFDEAPDAAGAVEVFEFVLAAGADVIASGDLAAAPDGSAALAGNVSLSSGGDEAAAGDPARRALHRNLAMALAGFLLIVVGALILSTVDEDDFDDEPLSPPGFVSPQ